MFKIITVYLDQDGNDENEEIQFRDTLAEARKLLIAECKWDTTLYGHIYDAETDQELDQRFSEQA